MTENDMDKFWIKVVKGADEVQSRRFAAAIALREGWGGITKVANSTGMSQITIRKGIDELKAIDSLEYPERLRKSGAGRKKIETKNKKIIDDLEKIMDENTAGDPMNHLKWTNKSTYKIAEQLKSWGHKIGPDTVGRILKQRGYSLQANVKSKEGSSVPERDAQFKYINTQVKSFIKEGNPIISVDTKKKELVGNFKNSGREWRKKDDPKEVDVYDFLTKAIGIAIPYGAYDPNRNEGFVNVGISYDTSEFAVESIRQWWNLLGKKNYPRATKLLICADGGGSNGSRRKGWKYFLHDFARQVGLKIVVCHYPPGTSKWNKIEHCMFSFISMNWRAQPLENYGTVISLINGTTTKSGLKVLSRLDRNEYERGKKFSDEAMAKINMKAHKLHPKWNYSINILDSSKADTFSN